MVLDKKSGEELLFNLAYIFSTYKQSASYALAKSIQEGFTPTNNKERKLYLSACMCYESIHFLFEVEQAIVLQCPIIFFSGVHLTCLYYSCMLSPL